MSTESDRYTTQAYSVAPTSSLRLTRTENTTVKIGYDQDVDVLTITLKQDVTIEESDEAKPGIILDFDSLGELASIEILDASRHVPDLTTMEYQLTPQQTRHTA